LFNTDLSHVSEALHVSESKISSKGIKAVRSRVAKISEFLAQPMDIESFRKHLLAHIFSKKSQVPEISLSEEDWRSVQKLAEERYKCWDWNYGNSPNFNIEKRQRFSGGEITAHLDIQQGLIQSVIFFGDFFSQVEPEIIARQLIGIPYKRNEITRFMQNEIIDQYFSGVDLVSFVEFLA
jgi:lipoate---protein ligase